jgi:hypothetical protein
LRDRGWIELRRVDVHADTGLGDVDGDEAEQKRDGADHLEIDERRTPVFPSAFTSPTPAMPTTTVQKTTGATIIRIRRMNASPSGRMDAPADGKK